MTDRNAKMPEEGSKKRPVKARKGDPVSSHHDERVATALSRNALQRERFEFLLRTLFALFIILFLSVSANIYFGLQTTQYRYFATDPEGKITEVIPLERPIQSTAEVLSWATDSVVRSFTMSFANYQQQLGENRNLFTEPGWAGFEDALQRNQFLDRIIQQQLVTTVVPSGAPVMISQGLVENGRYGWKIQIPLVVTFESASARNTTNLNVEAIIVRRPESESPRGLGIGQIIAR